MTETATVTIAEWLLVQVAADEAAIRRIWNADGITDEKYWGTPVQPSRLLAECQSKRKIVALYRQYDWACRDAREVNPLADYGNTPTRRLFNVRDALAEVLRLLALPYADRPGFREDWR